MPTEKNAAFLPRQQGFKLDRQRVNTEEVVGDFVFPNRQCVVAGKNR
jgi:hypothetical protein